jgi:hypothetical protein
VDVLVPEAQAVAWTDWLLSLGYTVRYRSKNFLQLSPPADFAPVDLMYADSPTFSKLEADAEMRELGGLKVKVANPRHLIAMKLHAMKYRRPEDAGKDWDDIVALIRIRKLDLSDPAIGDIFQRYGGEEALARFRSLKARHEASRESDDRRP